MIKIDVTDLTKDERNEMAKMLFKSGYAVRLSKEKVTANKIKYYIVCETGYTSKQLIKKLSKYNYHFVYVKKGIKKIMNA